jgi:hypothetical protein
VSSDIDLSRPRDLSGLVAATWSLWSHHRSLFFTVALLIAGPVAIISAGVSRTVGSADANNLTSSDVRGLAILAVLSAIELPLVTGAFARAVQRLGDGETVTVGTALRDGLGLFPRVFGALFLAALAIIGGTVLLVIPGIFLLVRLAFAGQAAAIEHLGPGAAFGATMRVTKGSWWRVAGIGVLGILVELVVVTGASAPFSSIGGAVELAASALIEAVVTSFVTIFQTLFYFDLRARRTPAATAVPVPDAWD